MKILHIISQHPEITGSGYYLQNIIRQAAAAGHRNFVVAGISGSQIPKLAGIDKDTCRFILFDSEGLHFTIPGMSDVMPYPSSRYSDLTADQLTAYDQAFAESIGSAVRDFAPDIIHSHHLWLVSAIARRVADDIPMVTSCHSTDLRQFQQCPHLRERVVPHCCGIDRILALSHDQAGEISRLYGIPADRIDIVGAGYDNNLFVPQRHEFHTGRPAAQLSFIHSNKNQPPRVHLLYAGKISFAKGVDWLLHTFTGLADQNLHLHLSGSGSGEEAETCLDLATQTGAAVTIHGRLDQKKLAQLMGLCHIFILPSFFEGLPLVLLEALACGCRIITTDLPGCRELLAGAGSDLVTFISLPPMTAIDRPEPEDLPTLQLQLAAAIIGMADRVRHSPPPPAMAISRITTLSSWQAVFQRILFSYEKVLRT